MERPGLRGPEPQEPGPGGPRLQKPIPEGPTKPHHAANAITRRLLNTLPHRVQPIFGPPPRDKFMTWAFGPALYSIYNCSSLTEAYQSAGTLRAPVGSETVISCSIDGPWMETNGILGIEDDIETGVMPSEQREQEATEREQKTTASSSTPKSTKRVKRKGDDISSSMMKTQSVNKGGQESFESQLVVSKSRHPSCFRSALDVADSALGSPEGSSGHIPYSLGLTGQNNTSIHSHCTPFTRCKRLDALEVTGRDAEASRCVKGSVACGKLGWEGRRANPHPSNTNSSVINISSSFVHTVPSLVFLFTVGVFLYDHNPQINFLKRKWMKNLAKGVICWFFVHVSLQVWLLFQQMVYILVRNYWQLPSHYVETSAILWDLLWGVKHQPAEPRIPVDFVYLCVTGACAVALLASVGRPRVVVKLLTTSATLGVENMLRVANNYLHRMKALLPQSRTRKNCFAGISEEKQETILARLQDLVNKDEQDIFIQSQIDLLDVKQRRPMEK
uniref:Uncharacterized protein n=1 Tax=Timema cristinae TaxID=61476 RepID=A0A7R9H280_TIMCR|nr:unnamed protein product [Timema cristinae]